MSNSTQSQVSMAQSNVFDVQSLGKLKYAKQGNVEALQKTASQFESLFLKQLLSTMREANEVFQKDSLFNSQAVNFYQGMLDQQMAVSLSDRKTSGGIADLLMRQFSPKNASKSYQSTTSLVEQISPKTLSAKSLMHTALQKIQPVTKELSIEPQSIQKDVDQLEQKTEPQAFDSPQQFVKYLMPYAEKAARLLNTSPQVLLAQAALETGWGKHILQKYSDNPTNASSDLQAVQSKSSNNLFNIKSNADWSGETVTKNSVEFDGQEFKKQTGQFRVYDNIEQSFNDFVKFLQSNKRYENVLQNGSDAKQFARELQQAGYATDPDYAKKIEHILASQHMALSGE